MNIRTAPSGVERESAIADFYAMLALLLQYPTHEVIKALGDGSARSDLHAIFDEAGIDQSHCTCAFNGLSELQRDFADGSCGLVETRRERTRLFDHPDHPAIQFYEGPFIDEERAKTAKRGSGTLLFVNPAALDAERCYRKAGVKRASDANAPADCITTELEFMAYLHSLKAKALLEEDDAALQDAQAWMDEFAHLHVSKWFSRFFERYTEESAHALYRAVGALGCALVDAEGYGRAANDVFPKEQRS